jgi:HlyD family secretion protein
MPLRSVRKRRPAEGSDAVALDPAMDRKIPRRRWTLRTIAWAAAGLALVAVVAWSAHLFRGKQTLRVPTERIQVSTVTRGEFQEYIPVTANVVPLTTHFLSATEGGRVEEVIREAGSFVEAGDEILRLGNTNLLLDIMYREAELFQQSNNLRNTKLLMEQNRLQMQSELLEIDHEITRQERITASYEQLNRDALISRQAYEEARDRLAYLAGKRELVLAARNQDELFRTSQVEQLEASLERMRSNLAVVKENLESLIVRAPISGRLTALNAEVGQSKARGERLGQIDVLDTFGLSAEIDEYYIARIDPGLRGTFTLTDETWVVRVDKVYPQVVNGRFEVDLQFAGDEPTDLRRGQSVRLRLELGDAYEALLLPNGPFYQTSGGRWVFVVSPSGGEARRRKISLGRQNARFLEVLDGLEPGEQVITSPYEFFGDAERLVLSD